MDRRVCTTLRAILLSSLLLATQACKPSQHNASDADLDGGQAEAGPDADDAGQPPPDGEPTPDGDVEEDDGICTDVIDVVFVLDVSSSMAFVLNQLEEQIESVVTAANELAEDSHFGLIAFVDNYALDTTGDLEGGLVHTGAGTLQTAFHYDRLTYTQPNRNPGDGPDGPETQNPICEENALDALYGAATEFPWRDNATRVVILATDDTFLERPDNYGDRDGDGDTSETNFPREGDYPALSVVPETVQALQDARVRVFTFTRLQAPGMFDMNKCSTGRRLPWSSVTDGWTTPYNGTDPIPEATDAENFNIEQVRNGSLSLSETINQIVVDSYCSEPVY